MQPPPNSPGYHPPDLAAALNGSGGAVTPTRADRGRSESKRKQTLLSLLDALNELKNDDDLGPFGEPEVMICQNVRFSVQVWDSVQDTPTSWAHWIRLN